MIITKLQGGLGNQMFQYALGRHLSIKNKVALMLDASALETNDSNVTKREYGLSVFNIEASLATKNEVDWFKKYLFKKGKFWFWYNRIIANRSHYTWEEHFNFEPWILGLKAPVYLDGFWNTEKYFKDIEDVIRKDFTLRKTLSEEGADLLSLILKAESVSLHVRRGDYISDPKTNTWLGVCTLEYYNQAINRMAADVRAPHFFIFSDDPAWAKENITPPFPTTYTSGNPEHPEEDIVLMSNCKHNIIANSTFSWWGAWLNANPQKIVIAPKQWFKTKKMDTRDIIPESWIII